MFKGIAVLLEKAAFWFIFCCVTCLVFSVLNALFFGTLPTFGFVAIADLIALLWCYFAGTLPILYLGFQKIKSIFATYE